MRNNSGITVGIDTARVDAMRERRFPRAPKRGRMPRWRHQFLYPAVGKNWLPLSLTRYRGAVPAAPMAAAETGAHFHRCRRFSEEREPHEAAGIGIQNDCHPPTPRPALGPC